MSFSSEIKKAATELYAAPLVKTGYWQGVKTTGHPELATYELLNHTLKVESTNLSIDKLVQEISPDLPWADDHFIERVGRKPLNPPPSEEWWPYAPKGNGKFKDSTGIFSHTYPERYWAQGRRGIRYPYGDLDCVVGFLAIDPHTRQAYLPVWFPEDLGAPIDARKPCTLGYHFIRRDDKLHMVYYIRSCDFYRHFKNDIYLTVRLQHWVLNELKRLDLTVGEWTNVVPGSFTMHVTSLHSFVNDHHRLKEYQ